jgi:hypothetical protein
MHELENLLLFLRPLNRMQIAYMVTGSAACIAYGVPRLTHDVDIVVEIARKQAGLLGIAFPSSDFYCPPTEVIALEIERPVRGHFNVIHTATGLKADCYPMGDDALHRWGMARRRRIEVGGEPLFLAPPEYVILRKLEYFREGGSEKHIRDVQGMVDVSGDTLDWQELRRRIVESELQRAWSRVEELRL